MKRLETYFTFDTSTVENFIKKQSKTKKEKIVQYPNEFRKESEGRFA